MRPIRPLSATGQLAGRRPALVPRVASRKRVHRKVGRLRARAHGLDARAPGESEWACIRGVPSIDETGLKRAQIICWTFAWRGATGGSRGLVLWGKGRQRRSGRGHGRIGLESHRRIDQSRHLDLLREHSSPVDHESFEPLDVSIQGQAAAAAIARRAGKTCDAGPRGRGAAHEPARRSRRRPARDGQVGARLTSHRASALASRVQRWWQQQEPGGADDLRGGAFRLSHLYRLRAARDTLAKGCRAPPRQRASWSPRSFAGRQLASL